MKRNGLLLFMLKWSGLLGLLCLSLAPAVHAETPPLLSFSSGGHVLGFGDDGFYLSNGSYLFQTTFVGARAVTPQSDTASASDSQVNGAPPLSQVAYPNLWPGIHLRYDQRGGLIRSSYTVAAGADPAVIRLRYNVPVQVNSDGGLSLAFETGSLAESAPVAWQEIGGKQLPVAVAFQVDSTGREVGFTLGDYDPRYPLLIDPTLTWNTFLGGNGSDQGRAIALDGSGGVYVAGYSSATWDTPVRPYTALYDAFVARLDAATGTLTWHSFLGGAGNDYGLAIAVDGSGGVFVAGYSETTWGTPVRPYTALYDTFVARLDSATGTLTWHSFLGGVGYDYGIAIAVDGSGGVFVAGYNDATWGTPVRPYTALYDTFVARLDSATGTLTWHSFLGGTGNDYGFGIAVDGSGGVYVAGYSSATWGTPVRLYTAGNDAFVARLDAATGALTWHTFLGGVSTDQGRGIAVDGSGSVFVSGYSSATWGTPVSSYTAAADALVARLDAATGTLTWHTFLGSPTNDGGWGIVVDSSGSLSVTGQSNATWGSPVRPYTAVGTDAFVARLDTTTGALIWNSFLGGTNSDVGNGIAVDGSGSVFVAGLSGATWGTPVRPYTIGQDAFVARVPQPCINSATTGPWNSGATWVGGAVPPTYEGACILNGHTVTLDMSPQIQQLLVETGGTLVLPSGFGLTAENFVYSGGTMAQTLAVNNANVPFLEIRNLAGTVVKYRGVNVNTTNNLGDVTARVRETGDGEFCTTDPLSPAYARRCYEITATNNLPANVRLWSQTTDLNGIVLANLSVFRFVTGSGWTELVTNRTTGTDGGSYSYAEGDSPGFSDFLLGDTADAPTAVTLSTFSSQTQTPLLLMVVMLVGLAGMAVWVMLRRTKRQA